MKPVQLETVDLCIAALLVLLDAGISVLLGLRVHRQILWSALRMTVQLLLIGFVLRIVFAWGSPPATFGVVLLMLAATAREVAARPAQRLRGAANYRIGAAVVGVASVVTVLVALLTAIRPSPWYDPHYVIPLIGIVLGSVLNAASLGLDTFFGGAVKERAAIEARLALGATRSQALNPLMRDAIRKGMIPIVNQMSAAGIITLPGTMTGQLLAGVDPVSAVKYQILLMFLLAGASGLAAVGAVYLAARSVTDERHRLRLDRLVRE